MESLKLTVAEITREAIQVPGNPDKFQTNLTVEALLHPGLALAVTLKPETAKEVGAFQRPLDDARVAKMGRDFSRQVEGGRFLWMALSS